jgi:basic membrane lipoprotein Med (substrate-binding protein (PBP1-ABC) superfamily)/DNA-binding SARP family transcriptional activator
MSSTDDRDARPTLTETFFRGTLPPVGATCSVRLLGPIELGTDGRTADLGAPKQRALLLVLLLSANETVPTDRLIELLWGERAPRTAAHSIQIYVSELRKTMASLGRVPSIVTRSPGYRLEVEPDDVDAFRFERLLREGNRALRTGAIADGAAILRSALNLWRGTALADFAYDDFAQEPARRWQDLRLDALESLAGAELQLGQVDEALRWAEAVIAEEPLRDHGQELVMLALYRAGRHVDALRAYERHRERLSDELGVIPSPPLRQLHERILLHDATLLPDPPAATTIEMVVRNPYKGLRAFREEDSGDFFGRDALVTQALGAFRAEAPLIALVGPSGSGKSSVVAAGIVPAVRAAASHGSERCMVRSVIPGPHPLDDVTAAIWSEETTSEVRYPGAGDPATRTHGLPIPAGYDRILLVLDQFEELFLAADEPARLVFIDALTATLHQPDSRVTILLTLRADFYDRPLSYGEFAEVFIPGVMHVLPMTRPELEAAIVRPAKKVGLDVEPALVAELVADAIGQPGSLPLLQYALTEQCEQVTGASLTAADYRALGGLRAILTRRAEATYGALDAGEQQVAMQVLLRMVRLGQGTADARRRVTVSELTELDIDPVILSGVLQRLARHRLLSFNRDPVTGAPSVEVAHEALLSEWKRLAGWIERHRIGLRRLESLRSAAQEWEDSGRNPDYLLTGSRLAEFDAWTSDSALAIGSSEREFLRAGVAQRRAQDERAQSDADAQRQLQRRSRHRLAGASAALVALVIAIVVAVLAGRGGGPLTVTLFYHGNGEIGGLIEAGFVRATSDLGLVGSQAVVDVPADAELDEISDRGEDLIIVAALDTDVETVARDHPSTRYVVLDAPAAGDNVASLQFASNEGSYLAGAAAALRSTTGTIGFVGGVDVETIWRFQAGYEAGARAVDPSIEILVRYLSEPPYYGEGYLDPSAGERAARELFNSGADVVFAAAGTSGLGVFEAAVDMSAETRTQLWAIGVDSDQYVTVADLPGSVGAAEWRDHILTSVVKRYDTAVYGVVSAAARGEFDAGTHRLGLAEQAVDISYSGGYLDDLRPRLEAMRAGILAGHVEVPCRLASREPIDLGCDG